ncbi:MAG: site-specific integrase [Acidimicrobiia bacterium]|nr:site-specific integrase [Acidimicrobiia bacterium]MDH5289215.1 site-specific integrase [Acidimicrobiia bacterium]
MARARSFGNIRQLPSGRYQARYWRLGKQVAADTTFASKTDARRWLATVEADMIRGVWVDPDAGRIPFGKYATRWVAERPVRPRTREVYEGQLRHIVPVFANVHLCDVHPVDVRTWHGRLAASGLHHNTVAKIYRLFRSIMTTAVDDGLIARNPVRIKGASSERMIERPLLTWDDVRALASAIHPRFECLVWTAAASGLRFGELTGLTVEHVNLERRELRVIQALHDIKGQGPTLGPPKTESAVRTVPLAEVIATAWPSTSSSTRLSKSRSIRSFEHSARSSTSSARSSTVRPSRSPRAIRSFATQFPNVPAFTPVASATSAIERRSSKTIATASRRNSGGNFEGRPPRDFLVDMTSS